MNSDAMKERTKALALRIVGLVEALPSGRTANIMARQLLRCGTSVGANYRAACRARSRRDFVAKLGIVEEECDEVVYWLELLIEAGIIDEARVTELLAEANEVLSIVVASIKTARPK
jgi:four helix bundle protein